jgi:hypothetical protein
LRGICTFFLSLPAKNVIYGFFNKLSKKLDTALSFSLGFSSLGLSSVQDLGGLANAMEELSNCPNQPPSPVFLRGASGAASGAACKATHKLSLLASQCPVQCAFRNRITAAAAAA